MTRRVMVASAWLLLAVSAGAFAAAAACKKRVPVPAPAADPVGPIHVVFSPDSTKLAVAEGDGVVRIRAVPSLRVVLEMRGHVGWIHGVDWSRDGSMIASAGADRTVRVWEAATGRTVRVFNHGLAAASVRFAPDGRSLVSGGIDKSARVWEIESGRELHRFEHVFEVGPAAFSRDGDRVVAGTGSDGTVVFWNGANGAALRRLRSGAGSVHGLTFTPDGRRLVIASSGRPIKDLDDVPDGSVEVIDLGGLDVAAAPKGSAVVLAVEGRVVIYDLSRRRELGRLPLAHDGLVVSVAYSPDGKYLASGSNVLRVWDVFGEKEVKPAD